MASIMKDCYNRNYKKYNWLIFYELDEFIHLSNYINIKSFLKEPKFEKCKIIHLNLVCHTDSNNLYYEDKPLSERFPEIVPITKYGGKYLEIRSIVNSRISKGMFRHAYLFNRNLRSCNGYGNKSKYFNDHLSS